MASSLLPHQPDAANSVRQKYDQNTAFQVLKPNSITGLRLVHFRNTNTACLQERLPTGCYTVRSFMTAADAHRLAVFAKSVIQGAKRTILQF